MSPEELFAKVAASLKNHPEVAIGNTKKGFGARALCVRERIFAMLASQGRFVVKLPRQRVQELVAKRVGSPFELAPGRVMKEWMVVALGSEEDWLSLAKEALKFASGRTR